MYMQHHSKKLLGSAIKEAFAELAGLESLDSSAVKARLGAEYSVPGDAISIPFKNLDGSDMLDDDGVPYVVYRVFDVRKDIPAKDRMRFMLRTGAGRRPYLPHGLDALLTAGANMLLVTEGPLKALSAVSHGVATIGIGGVANWAAPGWSGELNEDTPVMPEILDAARSVGRVISLADSDAVKNPQVRAHMQALASAIQKQAGVIAIYLCCKTAKDLGVAEDQKVGLDDWIRIKKGTKDLEGFFDSMLRKAEQREAAKNGSGGVEFLGYSAGGVYHAWSKPLSQVQALTPADLARSTALMSLAGGAWLDAMYPKFNNKGEVVGTDDRKFVSDLMAACAEVGLYREDRARAGGVWLEDGHLVVNSDTVFSPTLPNVDRVTRRHVYIKTRDLGIEPGTPVATVKDCENVLQTFSSFGFKKTSDALMLLGIMMLAYVPGALKWRPQVFIHGDGGSGKTTLMKLLSDLAGEAAFYAVSSTTAGIEVAVGENAISVILDEINSDGEALGKLMEYLRKGATGGDLHQSTKDRKAKRFVMRGVGIVAGVTPPQMDSMDESRFIKLSIENVDKKGQKKGSLLTSPDLANYIGKRLFARMLNRWDEFVTLQEAVFDLLDGSSRMSDVFSPVIAAAYIATHDTPCTDAAAYIAQFDMEEDVERMKAISETDDFMNHLLGVEIELEIDGRRRRTTVGHACASALEGANDINYALCVHGLRVHTDGRLRISHKSPQVSRLFQGTKWAKTDLPLMISKIKGADRKVGNNRDRFGGISPMPFLSIPLSDLIPAKESAAINAVYADSAA